MASSEPKTRSKKRSLPTATDSEVLRDSRGVTLRGVCVLAPGFHEAGGASAAARSLTRGLVDLGVPVTYVCPGERSENYRETLGLIDLYRLPVATDALGQDLLELLTLAVVRLKARRLNLIYALGPELGAVAGRVGRATGLPTVVKLSSSGTWGELQAIARDSRRDTLLRELRGADRLVAPREDVAREARERLGIDPDRLLVRDDGVDLAVYKPRPWTEDLPPRLLCMGPLDEASRVDVVLEACALAAKEHPKLELVVCGEGPRRAAYEELASDSSIPVRFVPVGGAVDLLRDSRVFVQAGPLGAGNALLEALSTGVSVIAARHPGVEGLVEDERSALLTDPDDSEALAAAIVRLLGDPALEKTLVTGGRSRAADFDVSRTATEHMDLFEQIAVPCDDRPMEVSPMVDFKRDAPLALAATRASLNTARSLVGRVIKRVKR